MLGRLLAIIIFLHLMSISAMAIESSEKTPQVNPKQNSTAAIKTEGHSDPLQNQTQPLMLINNFNSAPIASEGKATDKTDKSKDEGTEFCGPIFGFKFRLTDIFMVLFTAAIAGFTWRLYKSTDNLWKSGEKQIQLAREEFIASHRPRLILRHVTMKGPTDDLVPIEDGKPIIIRWTLVNIGDSPAKIVESGVTAFLGSKIFDVRDLQGTKLETMETGEIKTGGRSARTYTMTTKDIKFPNYGSLYETLIKGDNAIYFWGFIEYADLNGIERRTAFCRRYDPHEERFVIVDAPDHEYAD